MRTTLDIDDDVLMAARERAVRERISTGAVMSRLVREALIGQVAVPAEDRKTAAAGRFAVLPPRGEIVTLDKVRRLLGDDAC